MNRQGLERNGEFESGFTIQKVEDFWETAWDFLQKTSKAPVGEARQLVQDGNGLVEVKSTWDGDRLETITIISWVLQPFGLGETVLNPIAVLSYQYPGCDDQSWETGGDISDYRLEHLKQLFNRIGSQAEAEKAS